MSTRNLSPRQLQILRLAADGMTEPEIAAEMYIGVATVKAHARTSRERLGARNKTQAVAIAIRLGLLNSAPTADARAMTGESR